MNSVSFFKSISVLLVFLVIAVGGVCSSLVQANTHTEHCDDSAVSTWCGNVSEHTTLMNVSLVSAGVLLALFVSIFIWIVPSLSQRFVRQYHKMDFFVRKRLDRLIPHMLDTLFSRGILHPKIY